MTASFLATDTNRLAMSSCLGLGMRTMRQRERTGSMILEGELQIKMMRHWDEYLIYIYFFIYLGIYGVCVCVGGGIVLDCDVDFEDGYYILHITYYILL